VRIARVKTKDNRIRHGIVENGTITFIEGELLGAWQKTSQTASLSEVTLLAPIQPTNLLAVGLNYKAHVDECSDKLPKAPLLFIKSLTTVTDPDAPVMLPKMAPNEVDYEAELAIVIGKTAKHVSLDTALDYVLGYTCANDVSARDCQRNDPQWARGKSFDTFCPLGPWIETQLDPTNCKIEMRLNGKAMQSSNTSLMIFSAAYLVHYLSQCMTLIPGTVILSGTPSGCGLAQTPPLWLKAGDTLEVEVGGIGVLKNPVVLEA